MKKLIAVLAVLCLLCASVAALAEAPAAEEPVAFANGIKFGMDQNDVIAIEGVPHDMDYDHTAGAVVFSKLEYKNVPDTLFDGAAVDKKYLFVDDKLVAICFDIEVRSIAYEKVLEAVAAKGELGELDYGILGNGIYAIDDDGTPEANMVSYTDTVHNILIIVELDKDGDDIDVTILDMNADYLK